MEFRKSGDPFEVDPLPKSFYHPSMQRELSDAERKICLSPDHKEEVHMKSPADEKFLQHTNHIKIHEIPTRENGTIDPDHSSSSKFDESWPSTERALVSTPEADTDGTEISKTPSSDGRDFPLRARPDSTLARYIDRFRNAPPSSRQERDHAYFDRGKGGEFWWLSPSPPSSSTPKEGSTPDQQLPSPRPSLSPKLRRSTFRRGKTPTSPISKTKSTSSPSMSSLDGLDTKTAELQQRAKMLLEKSESTLDTSSSEVHRPVRRVKQGLLEQRSLREAPAQQPSSIAPRQFMDHLQIQRQPRPAPPPEEDILYQWRLARKMERAQEQVAKWGPVKGTLSIGSSRQQIAPTGTKLDPHGLFGGVGILPPTSAPLSLSQMDFAHQRPESQVLASSEIPVVPYGIASLSARTQTTYTTPMAVATCLQGTSSLMVPSQLGISQPQVPASSGPFSQLDVGTSPHAPAVGLEPSPAATTGTEIAGQFHPLVIEQDQFKSANVPSHMHLSCDILPCPHQRTLIEKARSDQTLKLPLSSPVVESMQKELDVAERDIERVQKPKEKITRESDDKAQFQVELPRRRNGTEDKWHRRSAESKDSEREELRRKEGLKRKPKPKRESAEEPTASDVLSGVIGEVVSERLFSTPQSSSSSLTGSSESEGPLQPQEPCRRAHGPEQDITLDGNSDDEFSDDEVLKMLRQRAQTYREQLRQIDNILNQQAEGHLNP